MMSSFSKVVKRAIPYILVVIAVGLLASCAHHKQKIQLPKPAKTKSVSLIRHYEIARLQKAGVEVIKLGETIRLVYLNDYLFMPQSANLNKEYASVLNLTAKLISTYDVVNIKVASYSDNQNSTQYLQSLTTRQAQVVENYLWSHGVNVRMIYAVGYNHLNPVDWNGYALGRHYNRRVELSFRYFPRTVAYN